MLQHGIFKAPFEQLLFCQFHCEWHFTKHPTSSFHRIPWHNFHAVTTISRIAQRFSISRIRSKETKKRWTCISGKRRASTMNIYPLAILFRCSELRIDIASFYTTEGGRSIERSFNVFLKLLWTVPVESPSISRASIVVNPNTRNIRSFSIATSLLNGTTSFFSE